MRRFLLSGALALLFFPASALAQSPTHQHVVQYERAYAHARHVFGVRAVGCRYMATCKGQPSDAQLVASTDTLHRMFAPAPRPVAFAAPSNSATYSRAIAPTYTAPVTPSYSAPTPTGGYTIPSYIVQCESHGNYSAVNSSSGAGGAYQIMPSTWAAYGGQGLPENASPAEQGRIAAKIYAASGASAWSCG